MFQTLRENTKLRARRQEPFASCVVLGVGAVLDGGRSGVNSPRDEYNQTWVQEKSFQPDCSNVCVPAHLRSQCPVFHSVTALPTLGVR